MVLSTADTHALQKLEAAALTRPDQAQTVRNIESQSPAARRAIPRIEAYLSRLTPGTQEYLEATETYRAYLETMIHDPHKIYQFSGTIDRLAEGVDNPRQWAFYERHGLKLMPNSDSRHRDYYVEFGARGMSPPH